MLFRSIRQVSRNFSKRYKLAQKVILHQSTAATDTVLLYVNQSRPRFALLITIAAGTQLVFWSYLSYTALNDYYSIIIGPRNNESLQTHHGNRGEELEEQVLASIQSKSGIKWRLGFSLLALSLGAFFGLTAVMYPMRLVNRLAFNKTTNKLIITTNTPIGKLQESRVSIVDVQPSPAKPSSSHYALKVKGHYLFYLLDKSGEFPNMKLFNSLIGTRSI